MHRRCSRPYQFPHFMDNQLIFSIGELQKQAEGKTEEFHLSVEQDFEDEDIKLTTPIDTDVIFMKTDTGIAVILENFTCEGETSCSRCLKKIPDPIRIEKIERTFLFKKPEKDEDRCDVYLTDMKQMEIDLLELFRQEILLHYDPFPVCSTSCKGICPTCGKNKNKAECGHEAVETVETFEPQKQVVQPLQGLKTLKSPKNPKHAPKR